MGGEESTLARNIESLVLLKSTLQQGHLFCAFGVAVLGGHTELLQFLGGNLDLLLDIQLVGQLSQLILDLFGGDRSLRLEEV